MAVNSDLVDEFYKTIKANFALLDGVESSEDSWELWLEDMVGVAAMPDPNQGFLEMIVEISNFLNGEESEWQAFSNAMLEARKNNPAFPTYFDNVTGSDLFRINDLFTNDLFYDYI